MKDYKSRLINFLLKFNTGRTITDLQEARNILNLEVAQLPAPLAELLTPLNKPALSEAERPILANRLRKLFLLAYQDVPMALVCVAHHTARMQFIAELAPADSRWLAEQNQSIYLPLLQMLGLWKLRRQLGKKSIELLYNKELIEINQRQELAKSEQMQHLEPLISRLTAECNRNNLRAKILPYFSHPTTLYGHLMRGEALKELLRKPKIDVFVETEDDCYRLLGIIHRYTTPLAGRTLSGDYFRDLIASPRFNGYRALITTVSHPLEEGKLLLEFRIQTHEMDKINADGVLATHFSSPKPLYVKNAWWENQELLDFVNQNPRGQEKSDPEIYVFSPSGEVHRLPINSSPIDYAYKIHSEIGNHCKVMWVNGRF
jgi:GTP pyrophosphokinase